MADAFKKSIPAWQQVSSANTDNATTPPSPTPVTHTESSHAELLEQAQEFLKQESIRTAPRDRKVAFLREKGLSLEDIQKLLGIEAKEEPQVVKDLKTVHDTSIEPAPTVEATQTPEHKDEAVTKAIIETSRPDVPPIITYPEFLMKPQKPPPLVTVDRLVNAAYAFAAVSALTYGASKYLVEPALQALSGARHELADKTLQDLETLNQKLESSVSHIPYIASKAALKQQNFHDDDTESMDSDPTELFHRDIATQTTPSLSRSSSFTSNKKPSVDATTHQITKLESLESTLRDLLSSTDPSSQPFAATQPTKKLSETITQFQLILDRLEHTYNPFRSDYSNIYSPNNTADLKKNNNNKADSNEAAKFKAEIRNLKGAFLSSRNFPAAARSAATGGQRARWLEN